jgi:hypothetical protein
MNNLNTNRVTDKYVCIHLELKYYNNSVLTVS